MHQREFLVLSPVAATFFLVVACHGWLAVLTLIKIGRQIVADAPHGLEAERRLENRRLFRQFRLPHSPAARTALLEHALAEHTEDLWRAYDQRVLEVAHRRNFTFSVEARCNYRAGFQRLVGLVWGCQVEAAKFFLYGDLANLAHAGQMAVAKLFKDKANQGRCPGQAMIAKTVQASWAMAALAVILYLAGRAFGLRLGFNGRLFRSRTAPMPG